MRRESSLIPLPRIGNFLPEGEIRSDNMSWSEAFLILKLAGCSEEEARRILRESGFKEDNKPLETTPLIKSMYYHKAYELTLKLKERNPTWGYKKIRKKVREELGIWIPAITIYHWITRRYKPNITPLRLCPELGYIIGALMSDGTWRGSVELKVKDEGFAEEFAYALKIVTGKEYKVKRRKNCYIVELGGSPLRYIVKSGLWKLIAWTYSREFLQGLYDGDGGVGVAIISKPEFRVIITLTNSDLELLEFTKKLLLKKYGIHSYMKLQHKEGEIDVIQGREYILKKDCWVLIIDRQEDVIEFYELIGFRIQRRQTKLRDAIEILRKYKSNKERIEAWLRKYTKVKNKWIPKPSIPFELTFV